MVNILQICDIYGIVFVINTNGKEKFTTTCGGLLSLLTASIVGCLTFLYGNDFFYKKNGIVRDNELTSYDAQYIEITDDNLPFMARLQYKDGFNLENERYQINFRYQDWSLNADGTSKLECNVNGNSQKNCSETAYMNNTDFVRDNLNTFICADIESIRKQCVEQTKNPNYKVTIGGEAGDRRNSYLFVQVSNFKYNSAGQPTDIVDVARFEEVVDQFVDLRYPSFNFDSTLQNNALKTVLKKERQGILPSAFKYEKKLFKKVTLLDDIGWLTEKLVEPIEALEQDATLPISSGPYFAADGKRRLFFQAVFMANNKQLTYHRRYMKMQDVMALVGGTVKLVVTVNFFLAKLVAVFLRQKALVEEYFETKQHMKEEVPLVNSIVSSSVEVKVKKNNKAESTIGFFEWYLTCARQSAVRKGTLAFYRKASDYISERMDVCSILDIFEKFQRLSEAVLTEEQLNELSSKRKTILPNLN